MDSCIASITLHLISFLQNSGHTVFSYGQYEDCLDTEGFKYNLVQFGIGPANSGIFMGLCLPSQCTKDIVTDILVNTLQTMQSPFNVFAIIDDVQDYHFPFNALFGITCFVLLFALLMVIISSFAGKRFKVLEGFSLQQSLKIFKKKDSSDLNIFNGVRSLAMMWVILGHYFLNSSTGVLNTLNIQQIFQKPFFLLIQAGLLSVDVFFFLGGFFLAFVFMRQKSQSYMKYILAILQRLLRIWPAYILVMLMYYTIFMHLGSGPRWGANEPTVMICQNMWRSIFFIQNLIDNGEQICMGWGWYLQVDFQLFLACLFLLFIYQKSKIGSYCVAGALIAGSFYLNISYTQLHDQKLFTNLTSLFNFQNYFLDVYIKPYTRCTPYFIGLFMGIIYHDFAKSQRSQIKSNSQINVFLRKVKLMLQNKRYFVWIVQWSGIALMAFIVFIPRDLQTGSTWPQLAHSLYFCFAKIFFIIGLILTTSPSIFGIKSSFFLTLLDTSLFSFLAKISFCTYLVHLIVIYQFYTSRSFDIYYSISNGFIVYLGCLVLSCSVGFILTVLIELPCSYYQRKMMKKLTQLGRRQQNQEMKLLNVYNNQLREQLKPSMLTNRQ